MLPIKITLVARYIAFVNSSASACLGVHILGLFLLAAPWYNFLGENLLKGSLGREIHKKIIIWSHLVFF